MAEPTVFRFPLPPSRSQDSRGWRGKHFGKKAYHAQLDEMQGLRFVGDGCLVPAPPAEAWSAADYTAELFVHNRYDDDGAVAQAKWALDWLQSRGYVGNDRDMHMLEPPTQHISRGKNRRREIVIRVWPRERAA